MGVALFFLAVFGVGRRLDPDLLGIHADRLYRSAWALCGSREDAEDLVQETYARVLSKPRVVRRDDDLGYLLRSLRNTWTSQWRERSRRPAPADVVLEDADAADPRADPAEIAHAREVYGVIRALSPELRDVVVAVDVTGLSYDETAKALKIPIGTVMSRLHRARDQVAAGLYPERRQGRAS